MAMNVGVLVFPQVEELDFIGPWEMLGMWRKLTGSPNCLIVAERAAPVVCAKGLSVNPQVTFDTCPPLEVLLVPGGQGTRQEVTNANLLNFLRAQAAGCRALLSVCTGAFLLHAAGLLSGKRATTHWGSLARLRALGDVEVIEARYLRDGHIWCAAGVSAGIDMTLAFIAEVAGEAVAGEVQLAAEYFPASTVYGDAARHPQAPAYIRSQR